MKALKAVVAAGLASVLMATSLVAHASVSTVSCNSDNAFASSSCDQCFDGGYVAQGTNIGNHTDIWENSSDGTRFMFKEEQDMPQMFALGGAAWDEVTSSDSIDFWIYPEELEAQYDLDEQAYALTPGERVTWIKSTLGSAYKLSSNPASEGSNIGMLVYDLKTRGVDTDGSMDLDASSHRECVLYKSGDATTPPPETPKEPPELPKTGAEHIILALAAILLTAGFFFVRKKA